jgi:hypothetical protein
MSGHLDEFLRLCIQIKLTPYSEEQVRLVKHAVALVRQYPRELFGNPVVNDALSAVVTHLRICA